MDYWLPDIIPKSKPITDPAQLPEIVRRCSILLFDCQMFASSLEQGYSAYE